MSLGGLRALAVCLLVGLAAYTVIAGVIVYWLGWPW